MAAGKKSSKQSSQKQSKSKKPSNRQSGSTNEALSEKQWFYLAVACAGCSILLYLNTLQNDFVFDDSSAVVQNPDVRGESPLPNLFVNDFWATPLKEILSHKSYRPLTTLSFRITALLHGVEPFWFHWNNILWNAVTCFMAVKCVKILSGASSPAFPVVTSLLFTFHPIHTEVVATIVGRADLLSAIFAFCAYYHHSQSQDSNMSLVKCLIFAWLSALCKETGLMVLGICGATEVANVWLPAKDTTIRAKRSSSILRFVVLAATGVAYLLFRKVINGPTTGVFPSAGDNPLVTCESSLQYFLTAAFIQALYLWRLVNPFVLLCDYGYNVIPIVQSVGDVRNAATLGALVGVTVLAIVGIRQAVNKSDGRLLLALTWIFVPLLPASHVLILGTVLAERLLYLPSLGFCMLVGLAVERFMGKKKQTMTAILVGILALYTSRILTRNAEWRDEPTLWKADHASYPSNVKIALFRAADLHKLGETDAAYQIVKDIQGLGDVQRLEVCVSQAKITALKQQGDFDKAYSILDDCIQIMESRTVPSKVDHLVYSQYGYLLSQQERLEEAAAWFRKAAAVAGDSALGPVCNEGEVLARLKKWNESVPVLEKCVEMGARAREDRKNHETKLMNLAKVYYMTLAFEKAEEILVNKLPETQETIQFLEQVRSVAATNKNIPG